MEKSSPPDVEFWEGTGACDAATEADACGALVTTRRELVGTARTAAGAAATMMEAKTVVKCMLMKDV